jgi:hypothetical protein
VATENNTQIYHNNTLAATLNKGEVYHRVYIVDDMTGSHVITDKPVAFFATKKSAFIPRNVAAADNLFQQLPPVSIWGHSFLFLPATT